MMESAFYFTLKALFALTIFQDISQVLTPQILSLTLSFLSSRFSTLPKYQDKNLNILRTKRTFKVK